MQDTVSYTVHSFLLTRRGEQEYCWFLSGFFFSLLDTSILIVWIIAAWKKGICIQPRVLQLNLDSINWLPHGKYPNRKNQVMCQCGNRTYNHMLCTSFIRWCSTDEKFDSDIQIFAAVQSWWYKKWGPSLIRRIINRNTGFSYTPYPEYMFIWWI